MIIDQYMIRKSNGTEGMHYELHLDGMMESIFHATSTDQGKAVVKECIREISGADGLLLLRDHRSFEKVGVMQQIIADITLYAVADFGFVFMADLTTPRGTILAEMSGLYLSYTVSAGNKTGKTTEPIRLHIASLFQGDAPFGSWNNPFGN